MRKVHFLVVLIYSCFLAVYAQATLPQVHAGLMLDFNSFSGDDANAGDYNTSNRFQIRKAAFGLNGRIGEYLSYGFEGGVATCVGAGTDLKLMEAEIDYHLNQNITLSLKQGHVLRGFSGITECSVRVPLERAVFYTAMTTCHPTGFVANFQYDLPYNADIEFETAFMNGAGNNTLDGERDYNFGTIINTPISGLAITGVYNLVSKEYYLDNSMQSKDGYRTIGGLKYDFANANLTGEYYTGKGFDTKDREYNAYYLLGSYKIDTNFTERINYFQPFVRYSYWDKSAETDAGQEYDYLETGLIISLDAYTKLKFNYKKNISQPDNVKEEPASFVARLQVNI